MVQTPPGSSCIAFQSIILLWGVLFKPPVNDALELDRQDDVAIGVKTHLAEQPLKPDIR